MKTVGFFGGAGNTEDLKTNFFGKGIFCCPIQQLEVVNNMMISSRIGCIIARKDTTLLKGYKSEILYISLKFHFYRGTYKIMKYLCIS